MFFNSSLPDLAFNFLFNPFLQVNLEYLARVVFNADGLLYPDSLVGTDSHTTMINGLGIVGWGMNDIITIKMYSLLC